MTEEHPRDVLRRFYDSYGWLRDSASGRYKGEVLHEDLDPRVESYVRENEMRYAEYFQPAGRLFLDAGCGAEPRHPFSAGYQKHVCVDISTVGLSEARKQLGEAGAYVVADLASLPFSDGAFDGVLASHCLYHIERDAQLDAVQELVRVTCPGRTLLVFYASLNNVISAFERVVFKAIGPLLRRSRRSAGANVPRIYYFLHDPRRLTRGSGDPDVTCLRILSTLETRVVGHLRLLPIVLPVVSCLEHTFPHAMLPFSRMIAIRIVPKNGQS